MHGMPGRKAGGGVAQWELRLYVAGQTPKCMTAFANLKRICEEHLAGRYELEVVDLAKQPESGSRKSDLAKWLPKSDAPWPALQDVSNDRNGPAGLAAQGGD